MEFADRQGLDEGRPHLRRDDEQSVGLAVIGGELGQELVVGDAGRSGEAGFGADRRADFLGDPRRRGDSARIFGHVEIGLVQRQRLDERGVPREDGADLARASL